MSTSQNPSLPFPFRIVVVGLYYFEVHGVAGRCKRHPKSKKDVINHRNRGNSLLTDDFLAQSVRLRQRKPSQQDRSEDSAMVEKDSEVWETSVEDLLTIFRDALVSLTPYLGKAHIGLKEGDQYDDYDAITEILFETIFINSIKWSFVEPQEVECPAYGFEFDSEKHTAFIEVRLSTYPGLEKDYVFQHFSSQQTLLDTVACYPVGNAQHHSSSEIVHAPLEECSFQLRFKQENRLKSKTLLSVLL